MIAIIVIFGLMMMGPWLLRQRATARIRICQAKQFTVARAHLLYADEEGLLAGYANPAGNTLLNLDELPDRSACAMDPVLFWLYSLDGQADRMLRLEKLFGEREEGQLYESDYYRKLLADRKRNKPDRIIALPEMNCPDQGPVDYRLQPDASTTIFNTGMPDAASEMFPPDWRANGAFLDLTSDRSMAAPVSLAYIESRDGLSSTTMISENIDAGGWLSTRETDVGLVWIDKLRDDKGEVDESESEGNAPDENEAQNSELYGINEHTGERDKQVTEPADFRFARPSSYHVGGVNVTFCDGSTRFINQDIDYTVYALMMSCDDKRAMRPGTEQLVSDIYRRDSDSDTGTVPANE